MTVQYPDVTVELSGTDGNAVGVISRTSRAIMRQRGRQAAETFREAAFECQSYDEILQLVMRTVETT